MTIRTASATDIPPHQEPPPVPLAFQPLRNFVLRHPVAGHDLVAGFLKSLDRYFWQSGALGARTPVAVVAEAMVEVVDHLGLIEGDVTLKAAGKGPV